MNKIKLLTVAGSLVMASLLAPTMANAIIISSGTNCEAANLNQALQGIGWSQAGVVNNATTSFFVVCPLDWDHFNPIPETVYVNASFPGSGIIECIARAQNPSTAAYASINFTISSGQNTANPNTGQNLAELFKPAGSLNITVVCALDPGEGIINIYYA